jgi:hypothetical protein
LLPRQALELVFDEMRRPDLTPSQRCALLSATGALVEMPEVAAFWERCAGLMDREVCLGPHVSQTLQAHAFRSSARCLLKSVQQPASPLLVPNPSQVGADVAGCIDARLVRRSPAAARWWINVVLRMISG